jgi:hypothetical protein
MIATFGVHMGHHQLHMQYKEPDILCCPGTIPTVLAFLGQHRSRWLRALTSRNDISSSSSTLSSNNIFYHSSMVVDTKKYDGSKNSYNGSNGNNLDDDCSGGYIGIYMELEFCVPTPSLLLAH